MTGIVDWAASRARMVIAFVILSLLAGGYSYVSLPKEGEPDIEIPALFISVPFPGISAGDSETLLVKPMETELIDLDGLKSISGTAAENYAGVALEFEFGWDKTKIMADVRDKMTKAEANFPEGFEAYSINEINFSEFPIIIVNLFGDVPERTMAQVASDLQDKIESMDEVLEVGIAGDREQMVEVVIDPLKLEAYNITAAELVSVVRNNNQLIAAGEVEGDNGSFSVSIPSSFNDIRDIYELPVKTNGDRVIKLGDLAEIALTFEDRLGTARFGGEETIALQVTKRKGFNLIDTAARIREIVAQEQKQWPVPLKAAVDMGVSNDQSRVVASMVSQLEGSVLTAIALVMIVVLAALGARAAFLVGFSVPTSFLLCFALFAMMGVTISNIVMFGLILAVGMLVDGSIVVVEYADKRIQEGAGPMNAYTEAAKRMFWPIVSSTATTLCAFMPMLFWPGVPGEFMGMLPFTLIFVLSASLVVALVYLPVIGGVTGRFGRSLSGMSQFARRNIVMPVRLVLLIAALGLQVTALLQMINPDYVVPNAWPDGLSRVLGAFLFMIAAFATSVLMSSLESTTHHQKVKGGYQRSLFGRAVYFIVGNPVMPLVAVAVVIFAVINVFGMYASKNYGVEFFVESEPEQAIVYVKTRGNFSLDEKDAILKSVEQIVLQERGVSTVFSFAGEGGLESNTGGAQPPKDAIGQMQIETIPWKDRMLEPDLDGNVVLSRLEESLSGLPGIEIEILELSRGPASAKPVHLRISGQNWDQLVDVTQEMRTVFNQTDGLVQIEDTLPLPGIDWQVDVDVALAGRYGADVLTVGAMVQLVTRGVLLDTMNVPSSDEEIEIRLRLPEEQRVLSTLDSLKVRTSSGLVPLSNFITRQPVQKVAEISRMDQKRYFDIKASVADGVNENERIAHLTEYLEKNPLPTGVDWEWTGDQEEQKESQEFLSSAFSAALGLMFIILLAQFNSFYNSALVLSAVVLSTTGVLIGMLVMQQPFSIIMTGTGIVALAGIVVNNNIVLIDTYQEYSLYMPRTEAITRTAEARLRPVLLTTITTMAGLAPMMFGISLDFMSGGYTIDSPTALWWKQLATAVVFGLGVSTILTLIMTPALLAIRIWFFTYVLWVARYMAKLSMGRSSRIARDWALERQAKRIQSPEIVWDVANV